MEMFKSGMKLLTLLLFSYQTDENLKFVLIGSDVWSAPEALDNNLLTLVRGQTPFNKGEWARSWHAKRARASSSCINEVSEAGAGAFSFSAG